MKKVIASVLVIVAAVLIFNIWHSRDYNGNNYENAQKTIARKIEVEKEDLAVSNLLDYDQYRFMVYQSESKKGYAVFQKSKDGDYRLEKTTAKSKMAKRALDSYIHYYGDYMIIWSENPDVKGLAWHFTEPKEWDKGIENFELTNEALKFAVLKVQPISNEDYTLEYWFYDQDGNEVK